MFFILKLLCLLKVILNCQLLLYCCLLLFIATGTVQDAIKEILGMTTHSSASSLYSVSNSSNFLLKVCGRDEYMEG